MKEEKSEKPMGSTPAQNNESEASVSIVIDSTSSAKRPSKFSINPSTQTDSEGMCIEE